MRAQPKASHYVNGSFVDDPRGAQLPVTYPATGETIAELHAATENIVEAAVAAARSGQGRWARLAGRARPGPAPRRRHPP